MRLSSKITLMLSVSVTALLAVLIAISLYSFRAFSLASATEHVRSAAEIVRVSLTESMINGTISKREGFLNRLMEVQGLKSARVVRSDHVRKQFGEGLHREAAADDAERRVLAEGEAVYALFDRDGETFFRGTIPFTAHSTGTPNCLQCHQVTEGTVLGAVTITLSIDELKHKAIVTVVGIGVSVGIFALLCVVAVRRLVKPVGRTAHHVELAVQRAIEGDFKSRIEQGTKDEIGQIAKDMNRLMGFLDDGLNRMGEDVAQLTHRKPRPGENLLTATIDMVSALTRAAHFKQAIEEDETQIEIYRRLGKTLDAEFGVGEFSVYEIVPQKNQMTPLLVDGQVDAHCRWCDPEILVRTDACRARRTGHMVDATVSPGLCYAFRPPVEAADRQHICFPIIQSGSVGSVLQLVVPPERIDHLQSQLPYIGVYLRESAPVLEAKRLMDTLRESNLRDPMTGLNNRRFLEEFVETLVANVQRRKTALSILMLDLDFFKMVNDTHGHDAGDAVLKALAKTLQQSVRAADMVVRYGGEEFLILLLDAQGDQADRVAENIRAHVEAMKVHVGSTTLQKTISIGIADFPTDSDTFWQAVKFADVALYQAKETGRNRVIRFKPEMWSSGHY